MYKRLAQDREDIQKPIKSFLNQFKSQHKAKEVTLKAEKRALVFGSD